MNITYLTSDVGLMGKYRDDNMVNSWGMIYDKRTQSYWIVNNGTSTLSVLDCKGRTVVSPVKVAGNNPTDITINISCGFMIGNEDEKCCKKYPSSLIIVNEDGTISGYNPKVNDTSTITMFSSSNMSFKGCDIGFVRGIATLYTADFASSTIIPFDQCMQVGACFTDRALTKIGYAPFGVKVIEQQLYVSFAKRGEISESVSNDELKIVDIPDVSGAGNGFIDVFSLESHCLLRRIVNRGYLNSPWSMIYDCGYLYVGNNGDGKILKYDLNGRFIDFVKGDSNDPLEIDGLWAIVACGSKIYFAAGINDENNGVFGLISKCTK